MITLSATLLAAQKRAQGRPSLYCTVSETLGGGPRFNWTSLYAVPDLVLLTGSATWIEDQAELDRRLPPPGEFTRAVARVFRRGL